MVNWRESIPSLAQIGKFAIPALLISSWITPTSSIPSFHTVNDVTLDGQTCPLQSLFNQECGTLCVKDVSLCPGSTKLDCPSGTSLCSDGLCHSSCDGIVNICACGLENFDYVPCGGSARSTIYELIPENRTQMIADSCSSTLNLTPDSYELWSETTDKKYIWLNCPLPPAPSFTLTEPMFVGFYIFLGIEVFLYLSYYLYKKHSEANLVKEPIPTAPGQPGPSQRFEGFKDNIFGTFMCYNTHLVTLIWLALLGLIVSDNYGAINGTFFYIFLSSDLVSKTFVAVWVIASVWLATLNFTKERTRNFFRIRTELHDAKVVQVDQCPEPVVLMKDTSLWLQRFKELDDKIKQHLGLNLLVSSHKMAIGKNGRKFFEFQGTRYVLNKSSGQFAPAQPGLPTAHTELLNLCSGLTTIEAEDRLEQFGLNLIEVKVPSFLIALGQEVSSFFYLYQMMCLWIWYFFTYYQMGLVQTVVIIVSALIRVTIRRKAENRVKGLAEFKDNCRVLRDGQWDTKVSSELVPGDVIEIEVGKVLPVDAVLMKGEVIADESMLTGEAMPVRKISIKPDDGHFDMAKAHNNALISGTNALQVTPPIGQDSKVLALVVATAIHTDKGKLIQRILFPSSYSFVFMDHLRAIIVVLLVWGAICFGLTLYLMGRGDINSWFYGMFVISQIMSPLLPSALVAGQSIAAARLRKEHGINCVDLPRIMVAGKIKTFCFDKTGTLTKEGLSFHGVKELLPPSEEGGRQVFDQLIRASGDAQRLSRQVQMGLASCHSASMLDSRLIGNPVDVEQFQSSQWAFDNGFDREQYVRAFAPILGNPVSGDGVKVVKCNEFIHARASMSVIVEDQATGKWHIFIKGSFEKIKTIADPASVPINYDYSTTQLAREGCYVLAMAHRDLGVLTLDQQIEVRQWSRDEVESDGNLLGLVIFRNQLKEDTTKALAMLKEGDTRNIMITGDNAFTGIYIARACGMIPSGGQVLLGDLANTDEKFPQIEWLDIDTDKIFNHEQLDDLLSVSPHPVELAVTGKAFDLLVRTEQMRKLLKHTRVYARMTPEGKVQCVELQMETGIVGMCGDGGNDCGALRAAHAGIALSEAEASIVAPFSAKDRSVMSCVTLLRYGRAALASSFASYKFLILYGEIMAWLELTQFYFSVVVSQPIWIMVDGFVTILMLTSLTLAQPSATLAPARPTAKLLGPQTIASAVSQSLVNLLTLVIAIVMLFKQTWYKCHEFDGASVDSAKWWLMGDNYEAEIIGLITLFQFINAAGIFNFGHLYRASWYKNYLLVAIYSGMLAFTSYLLLADPNVMGCIFRINCGSTLALTDLLHYSEPSFVIPDYNNPVGHNVMPHQFRYQLLGLIIGNIVVNYFVEYFLILNGPLPRWLAGLRGTNKGQNESKLSPSSSKTDVTKQEKI